MKREELEVQEIYVGDFALEFYHKCDADAVMDSMERRIARLTWCVDAWKQANEELQRTNTRLRKAISLNSLKEIEYMSAENADLKKRVKELEEKENEDK